MTDSRHLATLRDMRAFSANDSEKPALDWAILALSADRGEAVWSYCPECGSDELHHAEGVHKQCKRCKQEWFSDVDYTRAVRANLGERMDRKEATPPSPAPVYTLAMIEDAWSVSVPLLGDYCERFKSALVEMSQVSDVPMIGNPLMVGLRDPIICDDASLEVALREIAAEREAAAPSGVSDADALLSAMGLDPERFRTEAGFINHRKVMAAIKHPADYAGLYLPGTEYAWLIENGKQVPDLRYRTIEQGIPAWTDDHMKAIRFARRADAEMFAAEDDEAWAIVEHGWDAAQPQPGRVEGMK